MSVETLSEWTWTLVASSTRWCELGKRNDTGDYYYTVRPTGDPVPTAPTPPSGTTKGILPDEAIRLFTPSPLGHERVREIIEDGVLFDLYVLFKNDDFDTDAEGKIRVDTKSRQYDVNVSDQTTPSIEHFMYQELDDVVILGTPAKRTNVLSLSPGHGFVAPVAPNRDYLNIHYVDPALPGALGTRFSQHAVVAVAGDDISITPPIAYDLNPLYVESSKRVNVNMGIAGATFASPFRFQTYPPNDQQWDMTRIIVDFILTSGADDGMYGNIPGGIANGIYFGFEGPIFSEYNLTIFDNGSFRASAYDVQTTVRSGGGGDFGLAVRKTSAGQDKLGVAIRLEGKNDSFNCYTQDDLNLLSRHRVKIMGHIVQP
jgi:hypothetical protein